MSHTRGAVTLVVLGVLFVVGIVAGFRLVTSPIPELELQNDESEATCKKVTLEPGSKLSRGQVTVDVYNAGSVSGLASQTQRRLSRYDYQRGVIGNADDIGIKARNVTIVTEQPDGAMARLLKDQFNGKVRVVKDDVATSTSIAIVVGDKFVGLDRESRSSVPVDEKLEICVPIEPTPGDT
ncbi:LytR C-terminal domain-containing protein [Solicola gregarius]|uniref:LytR C-terminal domain-containing protein n=1 Tax=Solicola gregarius TaxID=2908642 RepID=A0AA46TLW8_9ACTN|nr:LytR C-terminal domain-containing protein [Solicola gregarius]UYM07696.1 LytR C-terminal domain-containing protein [Solicola gregarius]